MDERLAEDVIGAELPCFQRDFACVAKAEEAGIEVRRDDGDIRTGATEEMHFRQCGGAAADNQAGPSFDIQEYRIVPHI